MKELPMKRPAFALFSLISVLLASATTSIAGERMDLYSCESNDGNVRLELYDEPSTGFTSDTVAEITRKDPALSQKIMAEQMGGAAVIGAPVGYSNKYDGDPLYLAIKIAEKDAEGTAPAKLRFEDSSGVITLGVDVFRCKDLF
jgi:hypothetical protein